MREKVSDPIYARIRLHRTVLQPEPHPSVAWVCQPGEVRTDEGCCLIRASEIPGSVHPGPFDP